jgi:Protein of unknown function (DUF402)
MVSGSPEPAGHSLVDRWDPGTQILWRFVREGQVRTVRPMTVVVDRPDLTVAWLAGGTPIQRSSLPDGSSIRSASLADRFRLGRRPMPSIWRGTGILKLLPWGSAHSVWLFWDPGWVFRGWYVNLEAPHRRWSAGVDTTDHVLDIWVTPDRRWEWKDEDEFAEAQAAGRFSASEAAEIRAEGAGVVDRIERWASPFCDGWEDFRPDPAWPIPELPLGWEDPAAP